MFRALTSVCYRHRRIVVVSWVALIIALWALSSLLGGPYKTEFKLPGSESQAAIDILQANGFGDRAGAQGQIVFQDARGVDDPAVKTAMEGLFTKIQSNVSNVSVTSPYGAGGARQIAKNGDIAYATVNFGDRSQEGYTSAANDIKTLRNEVNVPGLKVELGGDMFAAPPVGVSEAIGIVAAIIILLIAFGSLFAMGLPIVTALFGVGCGAALVGLTTRILAVPNFTTEVAAMLGIGVGIDYALLIVSRFRQGMHDGLAAEDAVARAMNTAGRAVLFAGITVVIAVLGMFFMNLSLMRSVATGAALAVLMTMIAALTLLPALLGFVGTKIDRFGLPHRGSAEKKAEASFWYRWSRVIQRHPWPAALGSVVLLLVLASPVLAMRLGFSDAGNRPTSDTTRQAYDLLSQGFGPGFNGPLVIAAETPGGQDMAALQRLSAQLNKTPGVAFATPPQPNASGKAAILTVIPTTAPQDKATGDLVHNIRDNVIPSSIAGSTAVVKLGGMSAGAEDFAAYTAEKLPIFFGAVLALSFLLLMTVFRSVLVPLKAVIMNMLSIGAAFGAMVAVFQWGWGGSIIGIGRQGPIEAWEPMMLFAIVFGLSMDYEVFLLSRIREEYDHSGDNGQAVADGLAATARVITAAAAIMVCVFASFILGSDRSLKLFGFGLAFAVFIDATVVRLVLVPATMELLGRANWWLPGWLQRALPVVHVEGDAKALRAGEPATP
ncbi:MAG TPA: MMPL family transporter [Tepidiformaceae bacterium]|nr:MMPL family transporter [Tepidiformaceae bacterium]